MKAIVLDSFGGPEVMRYTDVPDPQPGPNQILIRVAATSINRPDLVQREGNYRPPPGDSEILGLEVAGTVEKLGEEVNGWRTGDRVMALIGGGGYAELAVADAGHVMPIPTSMSFEQAACVCETYLTAYLNLFLLGGLKNNHTVLLHGGGGGVNTAAVQICRQLVPEARIIVTASTGKLKRVADLGAHHVIDYRQQSFADEVASITDKKGVDVILDHIGADYLAANMRCLAVYGRLLVIGVTSGIKAELNLALMMVKRQQIIGSVLRARSVQEKAEIIQQFVRDVWPHLDSGAITPIVSSVLPLSSAADGHRMMEESQHFGKIVIEVV